MKNPTQTRRNLKPAKRAAQSKPAGNDRGRVKVPLSAEEKEEVAPSEQPKTETVRFTVRFPEAQHAVITRGAKRSGLTISKFVEASVIICLDLLEKELAKASKVGVGSRVRVPFPDKVLLATFVATLIEAAAEHHAKGGAR